MMRVLIVQEINDHQSEYQLILMKKKKREKNLSIEQSFSLDYVAQ
jgi:hypothetical protein